MQSLDVLNFTSDDADDDECNLGLDSIFSLEFLITSFLVEFKTFFSGGFSSALPISSVVWFVQVDSHDVNLESDVLDDAGDDFDSIA